jgi:hypothetical protein
MINPDTPSDVTLAQLLRHIWQAKFYMALCSVLTLTAAALFLFLATPTYKASMIVAPADGYALGDYASMIENDRIASMPFWRPKDQEGVSTDFYRFIHTIRGPSVAEILLSDRGVLSGIRRGGDAGAIQKKEALAVYLDKRIGIDPLGATPLRRITYQHPDPEFASAMLRKIHLVADQMIRRDRRRQSQSRIDYLKASLTRTNNLDHRKGITNLLMQQEHIQMLANLDEPYAAIVVEPAFSTPKPSWPNHYVTWAVALMMGMFFGYLIWSFRHPVKP